MDEVVLELRNSMIFSSFSARFPDLKIFRWCSSVMDYLEIYGRPGEIETALEFLGKAAKDLNSRLEIRGNFGSRATAMMNCRCSLENSSIRIVESRNFLWEAPASYRGGVETIRIVTVDDSHLSELYDELRKTGDVNVTSKRRIVPESLRDLYTLSISNLTADLTSRQVEYLRQAITMGFYASPRRIMIEDLARLHGISKSTMQEHLNKARNKLLQALEPYLSLAMPED